MRKINNIPVPGMRVMKTALAVFLCFCIVDITGEQYSGYSAIVAIICMQKDWDNSIHTSINRVIGTVFGATFGIITYHIISLCYTPHQRVLPYLIVSIMMVLLMYAILLIGKKDVTSVACIIFLSVAVLKKPEDPVLFFALRRMIDTFVGIGISLLVNVTITDVFIAKIKKNVK